VPGAWTVLNGVTVTLYDSKFIGNAALPDGTALQVRLWLQLHYFTIFSAPIYGES